MNKISINEIGFTLGRNKELNQKTKDERRGQILSKALMLFATKGLAATKITDIASAAGMSQGLLYHYYRSKEDIFVELIRSAFERMNTASLELEKLPLPPQEKIRLAIETLLQGLNDNEDTGRYYLLIAVATASEAIPEAAKTIIQKENLVPYEVITRIISEGQKDGSIKDYEAKDLALVFWTSMKGLAIHKAVHGNKFKMPDADILMSMFI
ncbi:MAG: TetR/AcrR family transcriptional regulator [Anaerolineales bacterium]|nr:TetR/AcrR family transcriptional regulator [Anaerolineales bacterium]